MKRLLLVAGLIVLLTTPLLAKLPKNMASVQPLFDTQGNNVCSTSSYNEQAGLWITAAHCTETGDVMVMGKPAKVLYADDQDDTDLAMLQADAHVPALKVGKAPQLGDEVNVVGFPMGQNQLLVTWLRVASVNPVQWNAALERNFRSMALDGAALPGHSGAAVLDRDGKIVAVLHGFIAIPGGFGSVPSAISLASNYETFVTFLKRVSVRTVPTVEVTVVARGK